MAGASLLTLLDDIATLLDDIAVMSKVAAKKTAGVLGDDLALNAQQVSGVAAEREIPVVWAVAKGSLRNKVILVPIAWLLSLFLPQLIMPLLLIGGLYLCFEGAEKLLEKWLESSPPGASEVDDKESLETSDESMAEYEARQVAGAIRTDFILSAEIIVIALGTVQGASAFNQILVMGVIAVLMTVGVYGLVAGIVKLDDLGFYLVRQAQATTGFKYRIGHALVHIAPRLMKGLTVVGTVAMFLVGGGMIVHQLPWFAHLLSYDMDMLPSAWSWFQPLLHGVFITIAGFLAGAILVLCWTVVHWGYHRCRN